MTTVVQSAALLNAMSLSDLIAFESCPLELLDRFECEMMEKYGIMEA